MIKHDEHTVQTVDVALDEQLLSRGDRFVASFSVAGTFDRDGWAQELTILNASESLIIFPYSFEEGRGGAQLVLLGEVTGRGSLLAAPESEPRRGLYKVPRAVVGQVLAEALGGDCELVPLEPSREAPELLELLRAYPELYRRFRDRTRGCVQVEPRDFISADIQKRSLSADGELEDGYTVSRYFVATCRVKKRPDYDYLAACLNLVNEREHMQVLPYYCRQLSRRSEVVLLGQVRRRGPGARSNSTVDAIAARLQSQLACPVQVEALYPTAHNPEHIRLQRAFESLASTSMRRPLYYARFPEITASSFVDKAERERREACEERLKAQDGSLLAGSLHFSAGTDMSLVARANGILRSERGIRIAPLFSTVRRSGERVVEVAGMKPGFFGPAPLRYEDVREVETVLGCTADVRIVAGSMQHPEDLERYVDAREALRDAHAATSVAAWTKPQAEAERTADERAAELIGLDAVLARIDEMVAYAVHYQAVYGKLPPLHAVFSGNAGTGKTTVARLLAKKLGEAGVLDRPDRFVETDRSGLVGLYVGHTAVKTHACIDRAMGGVLFVDEAYSLNAGGERDFGHEAVDALVKRLEDDNDQFVCILAGYPEPMEDMLSMNPGLRSRLPFRIEFPDYRAEALMQIFDAMLDSAFSIEPAARSRVAAFVERIVRARQSDFANARTIRNIVQRLQMRQLTKSASTCIGAGIVDSVLAEADLARLAGRGGGVAIGFAAS